MARRTAALDAATDRLREAGHDGDAGAGFDRRRRRPRAGGDSLWRDACRRLLRNRLALAGGCVVGLLLAMAAAAPAIAPRHFADGDFEQTFAKPGGEYPLGADFLGRDLLSRLIYGARISLTVGLLGALTAFLIGVSTLR